MDFNRVIPQRKVAEVIAVSLAYGGVYVLFIGPWLGSTFGWELSFPELIGDGHGFRVPWRALTHPRGFVLTFSVGFVAVVYLVVRARMAGKTVEEWAEDVE